MRSPHGGPLDVLVVGGGPAGSTVAGLLARRGWRVAILDRARFPRPKACGECVNPGGVAALRRLGLLGAVAALDPVELRGWDVETLGGHTARGRFGPDVGPGLGVSRRRLDGALLDAARSWGVDVEEGVRVREVRPAERGGFPAVVVGDGAGAEDFRHARVVVGADGLRSVAARALGRVAAGPARRRKLSLTLRLRGSGPPEDRGRLVLASDGTVGLAPVGAGVWNGTVVVDPGSHGRTVAADPEGFALSRLTERIAGWTAPPTAAGGPWGSGNFDVRPTRVARGGVFLVGDAAGYYDPLTGQGIYRALRSAELAAAAIDTALRVGRVSERGMAEYATRLGAEFRPGRRVQRLVESVITRPAARERALGRLAAAPRAMDALVRVTGDARPVKSLLRPSVVSAALLPGSAATRHA